MYSVRVLGLPGILLGGFLGFLGFLAFTGGISFKEPGLFAVSGLLMFLVLTIFLSKKSAYCDRSSRKLAIKYGVFPLEVTRVLKLDDYKSISIGSDYSSDMGAMEGGGGSVVHNSYIVLNTVGHKKDLVFFHAFYLKGDFMGQGKQFDKIAEQTHAILGLPFER